MRSMWAPKTTPLICRKWEEFDGTLVQLKDRCLSVSDAVSILTPAAVCVEFACFPNRAVMGCPGLHLSSCSSRTPPLITSFSPHFCSILTVTSWSTQPNPPSSLRPCYCNCNCSRCCTAGPPSVFFAATVRSSAHLTNNIHSTLIAK